MAVALTVGLAIAFAHFLTVALPYATSELFETWRSGVMGFPPSVLSSSMGHTTGSMMSGMYYFVLPLLVCLPHAASFFIDCQTGYVENVLCRTSKREYLMSKMAAIAASSGVVAVAPLVANFALVSLALPLYGPEPAAHLFTPSAHGLGGDLFYSAPAAYEGAFLVLTLAVGMLTALSALALTFAMPNKLMVLMAPFLVSVILYFVFSQDVSLGAYNPINVAFPGQTYPLTAGGLAIMMATWLVLVALGVFVTSNHTKNCVR